VTIILPEPCPRCGEPIACFVLYSTSSFGGEEPFSDYRPVDSATCPKCGHEIRMKGLVEFTGPEEAGAEQ
jgi:endogenous inhibitor of DNA gyrase (YacG/DUF329 family)